MKKYRILVFGLALVLGLAVGEAEAAPPADKEWKKTTVVFHLPAGIEFVKGRVWLDVFEAADTPGTYVGDVLTVEDFADEETGNPRIEDGDANLDVLVAHDLDPGDYWVRVQPAGAEWWLEGPFTVHSGDQYELATLHIYLVGPTPRPELEEHEVTGVISYTWDITTTVLTYETEDGVFAATGVVDFEPSGKQGFPLRLVFAAKQIKRIDHLKGPLYDRILQEQALEEDI